MEIDNKISTTKKPQQPYPKSIRWPDELIAYINDMPAGIYGSYAEKVITFVQGGRDGVR